MLGDSDDLSAVLAVLDRLQGELETNRNALNLTCERADSIGDGAGLPSYLIGEDSVEVYERRIAQEKRDCVFLRNSIDDAMESAANCIKLLREINMFQANSELQEHKTSSEELVRWQVKVEKSRDEYAQMVFAHIATGARLAKLYELLQTHSA